MRFTIKTSGLMCGHCDATVETALPNVAGVPDADADHERQRGPGGGGGGRVRRR